MKNEKEFTVCNTFISKTDEEFKIAVNKAILNLCNNEIERTVNEDLIFNIKY